MIVTIIWVLFILGMPGIVLYAARRVAFLDTIGAVVICYGIGLVLGNIRVLPDDFAGTQEILTTLAVPLALPLVFFSMDLKGWRKQAPTVVKAFFGALIATVTASLILFFIFNPLVGEDAWKVGGMLVGVYTGGTPNMAAIGSALEIGSSRYIAVNSADVIVGAVLLFLLLTVLPRILRFILPPFQAASSSTGVQGGEERRERRFSPYFVKCSRGELGSLLAAFGLAVLIFGAGGGLSLIVPAEYASVTAILVITTLGVLASFVPAIRRIPMTFQLGHYFLLVFSLVVSSMADVRQLTATAPVMIAYIAVLLLLTLLLHTLLSKLLGVDRDTHIITATALIYSPPFVPVIAASLRNREVVMAGMVTGIAGWVVGNYLGIGFGYLLRLLVRI